MPCAASAERRVRLPAPVSSQVVVTGEQPVEEKAALLQPLRDLGTLQASAAAAALC